MGDLRWGMRYVKENGRDKSETGEQCSMETNVFLIQNLKNKILNYDGLVLYGAGYAARILIERLEKEDIIPLYCIVTNMTNNLERIGAIPVYSFFQKAEELRKQNILVIMAVSGSHEMEIMDLLNREEIVNKVSVSEYWCNISMFKEMYLEKDFEWYLSRVKDWYFEQCGMNLKVSSLRKGKGERQTDIVFVLNHPSPRAVKIIYALRNNGKKITVLLNKNIAATAGYSLWCDYLKKICICHYYSGIEQLILLLLKNNGMVVHVFSTPWNIYIPYILVKFQKDIGKIVFDEYDIANGFYVNIDKNIFQLERYCLENASGICYREFSLEYLTDCLKFNIKGKTIRFFDYCFGNRGDGIKNIENNLSLCYAGGVVGEDDNSDCPAVFSMAFIEMCEQGKCHLHVYPSNWDENRYRKYLEKEKESKYFHFHKPVVYEELIRELSQYDYGIMPARDDIWEMEGDESSTKYKYIYASTNKLFDYIDAGLPIIAASPLKIVEYLRKMGVLIQWTNGQYDFGYLMAEKKRMKRKVVEVREELRIENQIGKLMDFYEKL